MRLYAIDLENTPMAYRKTALVLVKMKAKKEAIVAATIDVIAKVGVDALMTEDIAKRADVSTGTLYKYFPDKTEIVAAATAHVLEEHIRAIRAAESETRDMFGTNSSRLGLSCLAAGIAAFSGSLDQPRLVAAMLDSPFYCEGIKNELAELIHHAFAIKDRGLSARVVIGIVHAVWSIHGSGAKPAALAVSYSLRSLGAKDNEINVAMAAL